MCWSRSLLLVGTSALFDEGFVSKAVSDISEALREKGFARMRTDPDEDRADSTAEASSANLDELMYVGPMSQAYPRYLEKAATLKFTKFEVMNPVYVSGTDCYGRPIVVVCGAHFQHDAEESEQAFLYVSHAIACSSNENANPVGLPVVSAPWCSRHGPPLTLLLPVVLGFSFTSLSRSSIGTTFLSTCTATLTRKCVPPIGPSKIVSTFCPPSTSAT